MQLQFKDESIVTLKQANAQYRDQNVGLEEEISAKVTQIELMTEEMQAKDDEIERLFL